MTAAPPDLAAQSVEWMLKRQRQVRRLEHDLVLLRDHPVLAQLPPSIDIGGEPWRTARVTGELTLRDALPESGRLLALVPDSLQLPLDLAGRAYLGQAIDLRAEDLVAAAARRFCEPILDAELVEAVFEAVDRLRDHAERWSLGGVVTPREVRAVLVAAELGASDRLDRERDHVLLARWILEGVPTFGARGLVASALRESLPRAGTWLAYAVEQGSVEEVLAAGALAGSAAGRSLMPSLPGSSGSRTAGLRGLVELAVRSAWERSPERTRVALAPAEALAHRSSITAEDAGSHPLLEAALARALHAHLHASAAGAPPEDATIEALSANLHSLRLGSQVALARDVARLARFLTLSAPGESGSDDPGDAFAWAGFGLQQVAWADWCVRRVRRSLPEAPPNQAGPARQVLDAVLARRDALNLAFAHALARNWGQVAGSKDLRRPLPLHQVTRCLVRRLLDDEHRVLLVVLDGCDASTFLELALGLPEGDALGLVLPAVKHAGLRADLAAMTALQAGIAPVPTVTSHARRALFAGEIPGNLALDQVEAHPANASADRGAWARNSALGKTPRRLLLKGDLGVDGAALLDGLKRGEDRLLGVVFNGVDDALSSKETTPLPAWSLGGLGGGAQEALRVAVAEGWTVLITADHGHTPHLAADRRIAPRGGHARFSPDPLEGAVTFTSGPLPLPAIHAATQVGAYVGGQRRGYHGGAGIEEVVVPLAFLGRASPGQGRPVAPPWWWSAETLLDTCSDEAPMPALPPSSATDPEQVALGEVPMAVISALADRADAVRAVQLIAQHDVLTLDRLAPLVGRPPFLVRGMMATVQRDLARAGIPLPFVEDGDDLQRTYRWRRRS